MNEKEHWLLGALNHFKQHRSVIEWNLKRDKEELAKRDKLGKERGITEPIVIPEGYIDRDKQLREGIEISEKQLKECDEIIQDIHKASFSIK